MACTVLGKDTFALGEASHEGVVATFPPPDSGKRERQRRKTLTPISANCFSGTGIGAFNVSFQNRGVGGASRPPVERVLAQ